MECSFKKLSQLNALKEILICSFKGTVQRDIRRVKSGTLLRLAWCIGAACFVSVPASCLGCGVLDSVPSVRPSFGVLS
jgi:hypothetical protein